MTFLRVVAPLMAAFLPAGAEGLEAIKADVDVQRRYRAALDYSAQQITAARKAYEESRMKAFEAALGEVVAGAKLCDETLRAPGKNRVRNAIHFKRAELKLREILRRLDQLEKEAGVDDRAPVRNATAEIHKIHEQLLMDITGRRRIP